MGEVRKATVIRARSFRTGAPPSPVATHTYFIGADGPRTDRLPVISLATDRDGFFDYDRGIYMLGKIFDDYRAAHPSEQLTGHTPANYTQRGPAWNRAASLEWFEPGPPGSPPGTLQRQFEQAVDLDIQGQSSRSFRQKSFGVKARDRYGDSGDLDYPIFTGLSRLGDGSPLESFRTLRLRNAGNDWEYAMLRDSWTHRMVRGLGLEIMNSRPAVIYLNGEFWGVLEVRENQDPLYIEAHYGIDDDEVIILYGPGSLEEGRSGDAQPYTDLLTFCQTRDLANAANYNHVAARVDVENCLRYFLTEIYFANIDWPQNNIRVWRRRLATPDASLGSGRDGRWRWLLFDLDLGSAHPWSAGAAENTLAVALSSTGRSGFNTPWGTAVLRGLLKNPAFKNDFINTAADFLNSHFASARAVALVNQMESELLPAMDEHIKRWQAPGTSVTSWRSRVGIVRNFAQQRTQNVRQHFIQSFALGGSGQLTVNVEGGTTRGRIRVNRLLIDATLPGANVAAPYPWVGTYFRNVPVQLEAVPESGWMFAGWTGIEAATPQATWNPSGAITATARFLAVPPDFVRIEYLDPEASVRLTLEGTPSATYTLQTSPDLVTWSDARDVTMASDGRAVAELTIDPGSGMSYFRAVSR